MSATLVVSSEPAPKVVIPLEEQLEKLGEYSAPDSLLYYPSTSFNFSFDLATFTYKGSLQSLNMYAVTLDNTPLPSWISFDGPSMTFSGKTPDAGSLISPPELFGIQLIASDILGFAGVSIPFNVVVENHKLVWHDSFLEANATAGAPFEFKDLEGNLELDGSKIASSDLASVTADVPKWITFNNATYVLSGIPPVTASSENVTITALDRHGGKARAIVEISVSGDFFVDREIAPLNATIGKPFTYNVSTAFVDPSAVDVLVSISPKTSWLSYDAQTFILSGNVPNTTAASTIEITLTASSKSSPLSKRAVATKSFTINVVSPPPNASTSSSLSTQTSPSATSSETSGVIPLAAVKKGLSPGQIAAAVVVPIVVLAMLSLLAFCCWRRRRHSQLVKRVSTPMKRDISNPVMQEPARIMSMSGSPASSHPSLDPVAHNFTEDIYGSTDSFSVRPREPRRSATFSKLSSHPTSQPEHERDPMPRSYSENYLPSNETSWQSQGGALEPSAGRGSHPMMRNFSRKTGVTEASYDTDAMSRVTTKESAWQYHPYRTRSDHTRGSSWSIQATPETSYMGLNNRYRVHKRRNTPNYLGSLSAISTRRYSGVGHGRNPSSILSERSSNEPTQWNWVTTRSYGRGGEPKASMETDNSWLTIPPSPKKSLGAGLRPYSTMSAVTESTDVLHATDLPSITHTHPMTEASTGNPRNTIRVVSNSSEIPTSALMSSNQFANSSSSSLARPVSRRAGSSPFFTGSSRTNSRAASRRSAKMLESYLFSDVESPAITERDETNASLERSILAELRADRYSTSSNTQFVMTEEPRDMLGIRYIRDLRDEGNDSYRLGYRSPEESTRQLHTFVSSLENRESWETRKPPSFTSPLSDASSRFRDPSHSPYLYGNNQDKENAMPDNKLAKYQSFTSNWSARTPRTFRDSRGNSIRYDDDESPEIASAAFVERPSLLSPHKSIFGERLSAFSNGMLSPGLSPGHLVPMSPRQVNLGGRMVSGPERDVRVSPSREGMTGSLTTESLFMDANMGPTLSEEDFRLKMEEEEERRREEREGTPGISFL